MSPPPGKAPLALAPDDLFLRVQTALAGEYSIDRELGRGGMGVVYLAREVRLAREVAIKVLPPALAASQLMREQFLREAQTAARLSHPNIVPIHRVGDADQLVYFVMSYVAGHTLSERIRDHGPLAPHRAARLLREVAWALTYAHANGIVHRDVKADNILLEQSGDRALVTDFGIAGAANADARDADGRVAGSAHYASPEQIGGEPLTPSSDIYSLGVVGYLALTGRLPFDAPTSDDVLTMHLSTRAPAINAIAPTVPPRLAQLVERCLAKRPEQRFPSASALAEALDQAIEPPREIPAPLRVWVNRTNQYARMQVAGSLYLMLGVDGPIIAGGGDLLLIVPITLAIFGLVGVLPTVLTTSRVVAEGYGIDDLRYAMREYWLRRREEMAYEITAQTSVKRFTNWLFGLSAATAFSLSVLLATTMNEHAPLWAQLGAFLSWVLTFGTGALLGADRYRSRHLHNAGGFVLRFFDGKWGERLVRLAGLGVKHKKNAAALPQLTEVALSRATDALFAALPKPLRKQLADLPATVRHLESDAKTLRAEIEKLDASIGALDGDARAAIPSAIAASAHETEIRARRDALRADLRLTRERAAERLAATVAALENIRIGLLRLQLGDGHIESVTASLDAARHVAADLDAQAAGFAEVHATLAKRTTDR